MYRYVWPFQDNRIIAVTLAAAEAEHEEQPGTGNCLTPSCIPSCFFP
jgi:hypothetical protein